MLGLSTQMTKTVSVILTLLNSPPLSELSLGQSRGFTVLKKLSRSRSICSRIFPKGSSIFKLGISDYPSCVVRVCHEQSIQTSLEPSRNRPRSSLLGQ